MDLDLRFVRYFTVVARHENFGRAAAELRLAQPTLSRYIRRLEQDLGVQLFERSSRGTQLTEAGVSFRPLAETLLDDAARAVAQVLQVATPHRLTVGYVGGLIITPAVAHLKRTNPGIDVRTLHLHWSDAHAALLDHRADVVVARTPFPTDGLRTTVLYEEPRVLLVPLGHRLANRPSVTLQDFAEEPLVGYDRADYDAFWRVTPRPDGSPAPYGPVADVWHDKLESVASGAALAVAPSGPGNGAPRPDLIAVPVEGIAWSTIVVASRLEHRKPLVAAFEKSAKAKLVPSGCPPK
ncbi:LysR family transcriptional regulator [Agreia bicolorata]|uniref:LysR family transcriptional regulator n=1 Tax=Agreia bicolorata TaxID=110935 RepID=A0ABR5CC63_9MICO|nr:LysR family transcriptional regulator [Agreia bicolorata]KJC63218.1 LysR family transcriptional regulator [Agreia bicolorata]